MTMTTLFLEWCAGGAQERRKAAEAGAVLLLPRAGTAVSVPAAVLAAWHCASSGAGRSRAWGPAKRPDNLADVCPAHLQQILVSFCTMMNILKLNKPVTASIFKRIKCFQANVICKLLLGNVDVGS